MQTRVRLAVNGQAVDRAVDVRRSLSDFLREDLGLTGTHVGCEHGVCGACTVLADGERGWRGRGVGRRLPERVIELGRELGYHKLMLAACPVNRAGVALYERCGFREVGVYREQGMLDGRWIDVVVMERLL